MNIEITARKVVWIVGHWRHWTLNFAIALVSGILLLPLVRKHPMAVHEFANSLPLWLHKGLIFLICLVVAYGFLKLFSPKIAQLYHWKSTPPIWSAWLLGVVFTALIDLLSPLSTTVYKTQIDDWLCYLILPVAIVWLCRSFSSWFDSEAGAQFLSPLLTIEEDKTNEGEISLETIETVPWPKIEEWLLSESPANYDLLKNRIVAHRLAAMLTDGKQSIGIVGPFGSGKSSIVGWIKEAVEKHASANKIELLFCEVSCWGFQSSSASIQIILDTAIKKIGEKVDTFRIRSLPDSYRRTFSAGGKWIENVSQILLGKPDPLQQFGLLSSLLNDINVKLVFIVEDLDRNNTKSFDIQEVLAFLQMLRSFENLTFILTGDQDSKRDIDFDKLCDHVEFVKLLDVNLSTRIVSRVGQWCTGQDNFKFIPVVPFRDEEAEGESLYGFGIRFDEVTTIEDASARLLTTPRAIRRALSRTFLAWQKLRGEVEFDYLLGVNVLRHGAPEAFRFLVRNWDRLRNPATEQRLIGDVNEEHLKKVLAAEWQEAVRAGDWSERAARRFIKFLLPTSEFWLEEEGKNIEVSISLQPLHDQKYWNRIVTETIEEDELRDQALLGDTKMWIETKDSDGDLIKNLTASREYGERWLALSDVFSKKDKSIIRELCSQILTRIAKIHGPKANELSNGFETAKRLMHGAAAYDDVNAEWLQELVVSIAPTSLNLASDIRLRFLRSNREYYWDGIRKFVADELPKKLDTVAISQATCIEEQWALRFLVFDRSVNFETNYHFAKTWQWLGKPALEAMLKGEAGVVIGVARLLLKHHDDQGSNKWDPIEVDPVLLKSFFKGKEKQVADAMIGGKELAGLENARELLELLANSYWNSLRQKSMTASSADAETHKMGEFYFESLAKQELDGKEETETQTTVGSLE